MSTLWAANIAAGGAVLYLILGVVGVVPLPNPLDLPFLHGVERAPIAASPEPHAFPLFPTITGEEEIAPPGPPPGPPLAGPSPS